MTRQKNNMFGWYFRVLALFLGLAVLGATCVVTAGENESAAGIPVMKLAFDEKKPEIESNFTTVELSRDRIFENYISDEISSSKDIFRGPCLEMISCDIEVFNLIQNSDISDPEYLEREKGITVKISYNGNDMNRLQKTLWSYESDATGIYRIFFKSEYNSEIGFILICFEDQDCLIEDIKFKMTAADALKYKDSLNNGLYLDRNSWSSLEIFPDGQISMYEDPKSSIQPLNPVTLNDAKSLQVLTKDEVFKEFILKKNDSLNLISQKIIRACMDKDWSYASELSEELIILSDSVKAEVNKMILSEDTNDVRKDYLKILDSYRDSAMYLWYGTTFRDETGIKDGVLLLKTGIELANDVYESLGERPVEEYKVVISSAENIIPETLRLTEVYKYQDSNKENDISIRIEDYGYKNSVWVEDNGNFRLLTSEYGRKFFFVVVDVTHMGFRGGDMEYIYTPENSKFTLFFKGVEFSDSTPEKYIRSIGVPYAKVKLNRRENFEGVMLFEVPDDFCEDDAYISVDLGDERVPAWSFEFPENNSLDL